jgi:serine/threonine protein kinase
VSPFPAVTRVAAIRAACGACRDAPVTCSHTSAPPLLSLRRRSFNAKLGDLGTARQLDVEMTANVGTPLYRAPEAMSNTFDRTRYDAACDMYAMGLVVWAVMHLECNPFPGFTKEAPLAVAVTRGQRPVINDAVFAFEGGDRLRALMCALWDPEPSRRPTAAAALAELEGVASVALTREELEGRPPPTARPSLLGGVGSPGGRMSRLTSMFGTATTHTTATATTAVAGGGSTLAASRGVSLQRTAGRAGGGGGGGGAGGGGASGSTRFLGV